MNTAKTSVQKRKRRHARIRAKISGTATRPRLHVKRSLSGVWAQLVDDQAGSVLVSANSKKDNDGDAGERSGKVAAAYKVGLALAKKAAEKNITAVVFDRAGNKYHGRVQALADGARDGGLTF